MVRIASVAEFEEGEVPDVTLRPAKVVHLSIVQRSLWVSNKLYNWVGALRLGNKEQILYLFFYYRAHVQQISWQRRLSRRLSYTCLFRATGSAVGTTGIHQRSQVAGTEVE